MCVRACVCVRACAWFCVCRCTRVCVCVCVCVCISLPPPPSFYAHKSVRACVRACVRVRPIIPSEYTIMVTVKAGRPRRGPAVVSREEHGATAVHNCPFVRRSSLALVPRSAPTLPLGTLTLTPCSNRTAVLSLSQTVVFKSAPITEERPRVW